MEALYYDDQLPQISLFSPVQILKKSGLLG